MRLELHINTDNDAFGAEDEDESTAQIELTRILATVVEEIQTNGYDLNEVRRLLDANGNRVGYWVFTDAPL